MGHKAILDIMCKMYAQLGVPFLEEPRGLVEGNGRPADVMVDKMVLIPKEAHEGADGKIAWDVGVTEPVSTRLHGSNEWMVPL